MTPEEIQRLARCFQFWADHFDNACQTTVNSFERGQLKGRAQTYLRLADLLNRPESIPQFIEHAKSYGFEEGQP